MGGWKLECLAESEAGRTSWDGLGKGLAAILGSLGSNSSLRKLGRAKLEGRPKTEPVRVLWPGPGKDGEGVRENSQDVEDDRQIGSTW